MIMWFYPHHLSCVHTCWESIRRILKTIVKLPPFCIPTCSLRLVLSFLSYIWTRFSKVPIINGPVELLLFTCKIEVSIALLFYSFITGAQPKACTGLKMQTVRFFNVTLLGIYRWLRYIPNNVTLKKQTVCILRPVPAFGWAPVIRPKNNKTTQYLRQYPLWIDPYREFTIDFLPIVLCGSEAAPIGNKMSCSRPRKRSKAGA